MGARCLGRSSAEMLGTLGTRTAVALSAWPVARKGSFISGSAPRISRDTRLELARSATRPGSPTSQRLQQRCQQQWYTAVPRRHTRCIRAAAPHAAPHASLPCGVHMHLTSFVHASKLVALRPGSLQCLGFQRAGLCRAQHLSPIARRTATASGETSGCKFEGVTLWRYIV